MFDKELFDLEGIKKTCAILVLLALAEAVCILAQALGLSRALTQLWEGATIEEVLLWLMIFSGAFLCVRLVLNIRESFMSSYAYNVTTAKRQELMESVFCTGAPAIQAFGTGVTSTMALQGIDQMKNYIQLVFPKLINMMVLPVVFIVAIFIADWVSGVVVLVMFPAMILLMVLIGKTTAERGRKQHGAFKVMSNHFIDSVRGVKTIETFEISKTYADRVYEVSERFRQATMDTLKTAQLSGAVLDLFATLALAAVSIMLGMRLIDGSLVLLPALYVLILTPEYFKPVREFASDYHASLDGINSLRSINQIIAAIGQQPKAVALPPWQKTSYLQVRELSKEYKGFPALKSLSFSLTGTMRVGVIGTSGSGKSTLIRLLAGMEDPSSGAIAVDEVPLTTLRQKAWQSQLAYIPQNPYLFNVSLRDNLTYYNPQASEERIAKAVEVMGLQGLLDSLPAGLDSFIGEGGRGLSGGQAQRIALARVFLDDKRKILLFDEPTAHLDIETEYELKQAMLPLMENKLVVFATHRLHWLSIFDYLLVLEEGRLVEQGTPAELKRSGVHFNRLVQAMHGGDAL